VTAMAMTSRTICSGVCFLPSMVPFGQVGRAVRYSIVGAVIPSCLDSDGET
jgi:hypothetical protein